MHWVTKPDTSNEEEVRISAAAAKELQAIPGVRNFGSHIGQALLADEPYGVHFGENWISVDERLDYDKTLAAVQEVVDGYPGIRRDVQTYLKERIREVLTGSSETHRREGLRRRPREASETADDVKDVIADVAGIIEENVELQDDVPQVEITVDLEAGRAVRHQAGRRPTCGRHLVTGEEVGDIFRDGKAYDVHVWSTPRDAQQPHRHPQLPIDTPDGGVVRLERGRRRRRSSRGRARSTARTCRGPSRSAPTSRVAPSDPSPTTSRTSSRR